MSLARPFAAAIATARPPGAWAGPHRFPNQPICNSSGNSLVECAFDENDRRRVAHSPCPVLYGKVPN